MSLLPKYVVEVSAPSRLHFGLLSVGNPVGRQFGGAGVMIDAPRFVVRMSPDRELVVRYGPPRTTRRGSCADLVAALPAAETTWRLYRRVGRRGSACGLGIRNANGTCGGNRTPSLLRHRDTCCRRTGAQRRSWPSLRRGDTRVLDGGLIVEAGRTASEPLSELVYQAELPSDWRFLLVRFAGQLGRHGVDEQQAFGRTPPVPATVRERLWRLLEQDIVPAIRRSDFDAFGEHVYEYGVLSGETFAHEQGGPFAGEAVARLVSTIRELGMRGVGQSSWGPTVFAITPSTAAAAELESELRRRFAAAALETQIVRPDNRGAQVKIVAAAKD